MLEIFTRLFDSLNKKHIDSLLDEAIPKISPKEEGTIQAKARHLQPKKSQREKRM